MDITPKEAKGALYHMSIFSFKERVSEWLQDKDCLPEAAWSIELCSNKDSVKVSVCIKKTLLIGDEKMSYTLNCYSVTSNSEDAVRSVVESLNEKLIEFLQTKGEEDYL